MPHFKLTPLGEIAYRHGAMTSVKWVQDNWKDVVKAADEDSEWELLLNERIECLTEMRDRFYELMNHLHGAPMSPPPKQDKETVVLLKGRLGVAYEALRLIGVLAQPGSLTAELVKTGLLDLQPAQEGHRPMRTVDGTEIPDWTNQRQFTVVAEMLRLKWNGRGRPAFACGLCNHLFVVGDKARWFFARGAPNPFVCESCDGPDVQDRWEKYWREVIKPILDHWGNW